MDMAAWLQSVVSVLKRRPNGGQQPFEQREHQLRERHARLERMAIEADVISRSDLPEGHTWDER